MKLDNKDVSFLALFMDSMYASRLSDENLKKLSESKTDNELYNSLCQALLWCIKREEHAKKIGWRGRGKK